MGIGFPVETPENTSSGERRIFIPHVPAASTDLTLSPRRPVSLTLSPSRRPLPLPRSPLRSRSSTTSSRRQGHWDVPVCHQPSASRAPAYTRQRSFAESPSSRTASADKVGSFHSFPPESVASCGTKRSRSPSREDARASKPDEIRPKKLSLRTRTREEASLPTPSPLLASRVADEAWSNAEIAVETEKMGTHLTLQHSVLTGVNSSVKLPSSQWPTQALIRLEKMRSSKPAPLSCPRLTCPYGGHSSACPRDGVLLRSVSCRA